jgi:hypothetical protein
MLTLSKRPGIFGLAVCLPSLIALTTTGRAQFDSICESLVPQGPGLYIKYSSSDKPVPITSDAVRYESNARIYVVPWFGPRAIAANEEGVWHIRSQTTANSSVKSNQAYVYRPAVRTQCLQGRRVAQSQGQFFKEFFPDERYVSLNRYFDHHPKDPKARREDFGLSTYFHFEVSHPDDGHCLRTDDAEAVGNLHDAYGFRDVVPIPGLIARTFSSTTTAIAEERQSTRFAGLSSEFVYLSGPSAACFSVKVPVPTASSLYYEVFTSGRDGYTQDQAQTWGPIRTELDFHTVPGGKHFTRFITWQTNGR